MSNLIRLSVSKSATFQSCKKKYHFTYILKLPRKEFEYHTFGRFVHRILELFHLAYINGTTENFAKTMSNSFNETFVEPEFIGKINDTQKKEAFQILTTYLERLTLHRDEVKKVLSVEKIFNLEINPMLTLTGMIDRVQLDEDGIYHVLDYKTSKSKAYLKDDTLQLLTYAYVLYKEHPELKKVRVSYIMLRLNSEFLTKEFDLKEILSVQDIYEKYAQDINAEKEFPAKPTKLCSYCDHIGVCTSGQDFIGKQFKTGEIKW